MCERMEHLSGGVVDLTLSHNPSTQLFFPTSMRRFLCVHMWSSCDRTYLYSNIICTPTNRQKHVKNTNRRPVRLDLAKSVPCVVSPILVARTFPVICQLANHVRYTIRPNHKSNEVRRQHREDVEHTPDGAYMSIPPLRTELNDGLGSKCTLISDGSHSPWVAVTQP